MDSDDLNGLAPPQEGANPNGTSVASTQNSSVVAKSVQSANSHTALLEGSRRKNGGQVNGFRSSTTAPVVERSGPKRKQRRVRDPYAIDYSDDDIEDEAMTVKPQKQEESLIDFLRNTSPTPAMNPQPILAAVSSIKPAPGAQKIASNSGMKDRAGRNAPNAALNKKSSTKVLEPVPQSEKPPAYSRGAHVARPNSPHLVQTGSKLDSYRPTQTTHASHVERNRQKSMPTPQARPERPDGSTNDLAEYLRNTGPPQANPGYVQNTIKDESGFMAFFSRRRSVKK